MADDRLLSAEEIADALLELPQWEVRDGWLRRTLQTASWSRGMMLVSTIGYLAEAAWHHPDLSVGYAKVTVKLQTHKVGGITGMDTALAKQIDAVACWLPTADGALAGFPKRWTH